MTAGRWASFRDYSRPAPYNVVSDLAKVSAAIKAAGVRNVGFTWAAHDPQLVGAKHVLTVSTRVGSTGVRFVWDAKLARYVRTVDGRRILTASGALVAKPNVLVQFCQIRSDRSDIDVNGNPSMFTESVGAGRVVLFRGGRRIEASGRDRQSAPGRPSLTPQGSGCCSLRVGRSWPWCAPVPLPDQMIWLTTYSMLEMSFEMSSGSTAGNMPTRSWLRPSLR